MGETPLNQRNFGIALTDRGFERLVSNGKWYLGIGLRQDSDDEAKGDNGKPY